MGDGEARALLVVAHPSGAVGHRLGAADDDERHAQARGRGGECAGVEVPCHRDDRIHAEVDQALQAVEQQPAVTPAVAQDHAEPRLVRRILDAVDDIGVVLVAQVGQQHPDEVAAAADEALRPSVRAVAELIRGCRDALPACGADARLAAQRSQTSDFETPAARATSTIVGRGEGGHGSSVPDGERRIVATLWNVPDPFTCGTRGRHLALVAFSA